MYMDAQLADGETMGLKSYYYILNNISRAIIYLKIVDGKIVRKIKGTKGQFGWCENQPDFTVRGWFLLFTLSQISSDSSTFLQANRP